MRQYLTIENLGSRESIDIDVIVDAEHVYEPQTWDSPSYEGIELHNIEVTRFESGGWDKKTFRIDRQSAPSPEYFCLLDRLAEEKVEEMISEGLFECHLDEE